MFIRQIINIVGNSKTFLAYYTFLVCDLEVYYTLLVCDLEFTTPVLKQWYIINVSIFFKVKLFQIYHKYVWQNKLHYFNLFSFLWEHTHMYWCRISLIDEACTMQYVHAEQFLK